MEKAELLQLAERYQKKADTAYYNYQQTGTTRYDTAYRANEDMADALRMAAYAADEHNTLSSLKVHFSRIARLAEDIKYKPEEVRPAAHEELDREICALAKLYGI